MNNLTPLAQKLDPDGKLYQEIIRLMKDEVFPEAPPNSKKVIATVRLCDLRDLYKAYKLRRNKVMEGYDNKSYSPYEVVPLRFTDQRFGMRAYSYSVRVEGYTSQEAKQEWITRLRAQPQKAILDSQPKEKLIEPLI